MKTPKSIKLNMKLINANLREWKRADKRRKP